MLKQLSEEELASEIKRTEENIQVLTETLYKEKKYLVKLENALLDKTGVFVYKRDRD